MMSMKEEERYIKTTLRLDSDLFLKVKLLAVLRGVSFTDIVKEALTEYVQKHENEIKEKIEVKE